MDTANSKTKGNFLTEYLRILGRHKFLIIIPLVVVFLGSMIASSRLPKVYEAAATFRMLNPSTPKQRSTVEELQVMKQIILSRANLLQVISDVGLDSQYSNLPEAERGAREEQLVNKMRKNLDVQEKAKRVFEISYRSDHPDIAARVANAVMSQYIDGVLKEERAQMASTVAFLEKQVKDYQTRVSDSSEALARFKAQHILELPGSELSNSSELRGLRDRLAAAETALSDAETAKRELEKQMLAIDTTVVGETVVETNPVVARYKAQLDRLDLELATLKTRFTDLHPEVVKKRNEIQSLKSLMEKAAETVTTKQTSEANPLYVKLQQDLANADVRIVSAKRRKEQLLAKKAECEKRVQGAPALEKQMDKLREEDSLLRKLLGHYTTELQNARIEQEREIDQKGTRFRIMDYAKKSASYVMSERRKMTLLGLIVGGGLGLGLAVLREQMDTSFKDVEDAASFLDIPVIGTIPVISTALEKAREKKKQFLAWMIVAALVILLGAALIVTSLTSFPGR